ncbi:MAG: SDR family NAD(P)-dependent oxidoreductase [Candidatus Latescibacteria bacterium]|nr:SDR family NAD(P)-dependent oxidoreductase [Candidatus Latescibacterota bacterium]
MPKVAVIAGVGPGLGAALARKLIQEGCQVGLLARSSTYLQTLAEELRANGGQVLPAAVDIADPDQGADGFRQIREALGPVDILINHASMAAWKGLLELNEDEFERAWRVSCFGAFLCSRQAVPDMLASGSGAILFTGATSSIRGHGGAVAFSSAKFALRGLAQSMARQYWPQGIHVAHIVVDGVIDTPDVQADPDEPLLNPDAMAQAYWSLIEQDKSAWTLELDLRPHGEAFFE